MSRSALAVIAVLITLPGAARAQAAPRHAPAAAPAHGRTAEDLHAQVEALAKKVADLETAAAQMATLSTWQQQLSSRITAVEQELGRLRRQAGAGPEVVSTLDRLTSQVDSLDHEVEALRTQVAGIEQPAAPAGAGAGGAVSWNGHFGWSTGDGTSTLELGGFVQPRYQLELPRSGGTIDASTFTLRRARLGAGGQVAGDDLTYRVELELRDRSAAALDYYLDYRLWPELSIRAGQDKVYFTRAWWASDEGLDPLERPAAVDTLRYGRDIGVWAHGQFLDGRLGYYAGVSNGAGPGVLNDNIDLALEARVDGVILGKGFTPLADNLGQSDELQVMAGAGVVHDLVAMPGAIAGIMVGNRDVDGDGTVNNVRVVSSSADIDLRWKGLEVVLEGIWRHESWGKILQHSDNQALADAIKPDSNGRRNYLAGYVEASYAVIPNKLQVSARVGHSRVALLGVGGQQIGAVPPGDRLIEVNGQVRYWLSRALSLGASYTLLNYNAPGPDPAGDLTHTFIAQGQLNF